MLNVKFHDTIVRVRLKHGLFAMVAMKKPCLP